MATSRNSQGENFLSQPPANIYSRMKPGYNPQDLGVRQDMVIKNIYKQQLDELMHQKNQQKSRQKQMQRHEREVYNQRLSYGQQAQRLKDLSYKNYYQLLLSNQSKMTNGHQYNAQRDHLKDKLIQGGIEEERKKSQQAWESDMNRIQNGRRNYKAELDRGLNQKILKSAHQREEKIKSQEEYKKASFSPHQVDKLERDRRLMEMSKYREDLERTSPSKREKTRITTGAQVVGKGSNDFNICNESYHNPMTNPMPYNVQNPYLLRQIMHKQPSVKQNMNNSPSQRSNGIFG